MVEMRRQLTSPEGMLRTELERITGQECSYWGRYIKQLGKQQGYQFRKEPWGQNKSNLVFYWFK
jgi:hypothetical protein